jgi:hypothetical protein
MKHALYSQQHIHVRVALMNTNEQQLVLVQLQHIRTGFTLDAHSEAKHLAPGGWQGKSSFSIYQTAKYALAIAGRASTTITAAARAAAAGLVNRGFLNTEQVDKYGDQWCEGGQGVRTKFIFELIEVGWEWFEKGVFSRMWLKTRAMLRQMISLTRLFISYRVLIYPCLTMCNSKPSPQVMFPFINSLPLILIFLSQVLLGSSRLHPIHCRAHKPLVV